MPVKEVSLLSSLQVLLRDDAPVRVVGCHKALPASTARVLVREGRAVIRGFQRIQVLWGERGILRYVRRRDHFTCRYCGGRGLTVDHVVPRSKGGKSTPGNCVCACCRCNHRKDSMTCAEFLSYVERLPCERYIDSAWNRRRCWKHRVEAGLRALMASRHWAGLQSTR